MSKKATHMTKLRLCLVTLGVIVGIVGILHGSGELLQGSMLVENRSVEALPEGWPNSEFNSMTRGSPVFSLLTEIPFYALGILAISVSTTLIVCSLTLMKNKGMRFASLLFALLSVGIFIFGAGRGTPVAVSLPVVIAGILQSEPGPPKEANSRDEGSCQASICSIGYILRAGSCSSQDYLSSASTQRYQRRSFSLPS